ncbi:unannotated protein [freshwater metagenome]|uniref:Unannotated protein n=1 Tax=freshwater metagenome TaxID=449393 RepID=A0A6J6UJB5_9ZZZZ
MSAAIHFALCLSATITISDGPAIKSIAVSTETNFFAAATKAFPGPTIRVTRDIDSVPYAKAAIACAPPICVMYSIPSHAANANISLLGFGQTTVIDLTPATCAGMTAIINVEISG